MGKTILVAVDGSKFLEKNINYACDIAESTGSRLTLIHVVKLPMMMEPVAPIDPQPFQMEGSKILEEAKQIAARRRVEADAKLATVIGNPAQEILRAAEEGRYDLIVIGAKGHSLLRNLVIGSVADTVVRNASCPVLVVR